MGEGARGHVGALHAHQTERQGRGLTTTDTVRAGDTLIALPRHLRLTAHTKHPVLLALFNRIPEEFSTVKLGLNLLAERTRLPSSQWRPYIQNLPERFTLPIFFNADEIQAIHYPPLTKEVKKRLQFLKAFASDVMPAVIGESPKPDHPFHNHRILPHELAWSMAAASSRAFRRHGTPAEQAYLLPLVDMCNHSFSPNARLEEYVPSYRSLPLLKVVAERDLEKGESVLMNYGPLSNDTLFLDFGFVILHNPHDRVLVPYRETQGTQ